MYLKIHFFFLILFISSTAAAQSLSRSNLSTAGGLVSNDVGVSLSWTIGEVFSETIQNNSHVTGGFQQGELSKTQKNNPAVATDLEEDSTEEPIEASSNDYFQQPSSLPQNVQVILFPNPTLEDLWIKSTSETTQHYTLKILDTSGRTVLQQVIKLENFQKEKIQKVNSLTSGNYILSLLSNEKVISTQKFIKI